MRGDLDPKRLGSNVHKKAIEATNEYIKKIKEDSMRSKKGQEFNNFTPDPRNQEILDKEQDITSEKFQETIKEEIQRDIHMNSVSEESEMHQEEIIMMTNLGSSFSTQDSVGNKNVFGE